MIVPMKKVTLLVLRSDLDAALARLRELGVLHVVPLAHAEGGGLRQARAALARARAAMGILRRRAGRNAASRPAAAQEDGAGLADRVHDLAAGRAALDERRAALRAEIRALEPFGDFDPRLVRELRERGVRVRLGRARGRKPLAAPAGAALLVLRQDGSGRHFAVVSAGAGPPDGMPGEEFPLPARSLGEARRALDAADAEARRADAELDALAAGGGALARHAALLEQQARYMEVHDGTGASGPVAYLQGFCPADALPPLGRAAAGHGWGMAAEDPSGGDRPPTLVRNPRWIRPVESLFGMIRILPGYREVDVSAPFLFALSLFFAMIVGDAGYGLIFLLLTALGRARWRGAPAGPFVLMTVFSLCTIAWGVLSGAYFGITPLPAPLAALQGKVPLTAWLAERNNIMGLCLFIGSLHLSLAHGWSAVRMCNSARALAQLGWIGVVWTMFFAARSLMFGAPFPGWFVPVAAAGFLSVVLFMTPPRSFKAEWINHAMLPLSVMSAFGDVLSYLRLYALGVAGFKVAAAFNALAGTVGFDSVLRGLAASLILFLFHGLNVALSALSVLVHGVRLNALEFSMHLGLEWSGVPYRPFRRMEEAGLAGRAA